MTSTGGERRTAQVLGDDVSVVGDDVTASQVAAELAAEQAHVDLVYAEVAKASARARSVAADGMARGRTERTGTARDEELTGLFERDALVFHAARRQQALDSQYEGLVFGRLDLEHPPVLEGATTGANGTEAIGTEANGTAAQARHTSGNGLEREVRYVGRLGLRDDDYEPLVIDWRAPAAAPFYRATPVEPMGVLRRRVLRCRGQVVVGIEDDLLAADAPPDLVVLGDGALMAALTRSRGEQMRDIVATIQRHQDEAIRAPARGVTEIVGGPGTGKTVVALHRAAYLLYSDRRRFEGGGVLVVGPSAAYTAYIERVLPSLGEDSVALRALGDIVDAVSTQRHDEPAAAAVKGSLRMREVLGRAARDAAPGAPTELRAFVAGYAVRLDGAVLDRVRGQALRQHPRNLAVAAARHALAEAAWRAVRHPEREDFLARFADHLDVDAFVRDWWPQLDPREILLWLADPTRLARYAEGVLAEREQQLVRRSIEVALETGTWSVADVALVDELAARIGPVQEEVEERDFYQIDALDALEAAEFLGQGREAAQPAAPLHEVAPRSARDRLLAGQIGRPEAYAHVLVDEAQDLSPMQWRMLGRRGQTASWTVVGDAAQSCWPDPEESRRARTEAWGQQPYRAFHMRTNYRNAREIFAYAADVVRAQLPDADFPDAVRETGVDPVVGTLSDDSVAAVAAVGAAVDQLLDEVEGPVCVIAPEAYAAALAPLDGSAGGRVRLTNALASKGLEWDAVVVVAPQAIVRESPGGIRTLYVALTRAAHRLTVLHEA